MVFAEARREGKPVFVLISAVWCYWCHYFDEQTLETDEVAEYLNRHYLSVFVDSDLRMDLTRKYARGWPMTILFDPVGRVRLSFPGALWKEDFLSVVARVAEEVRSGAPGAGPVEREVARPGVTVPPTAATYRQLVDGIARYVDEQVDTLHGGFGTGRKFPHGRLLAYLLTQEEVTRDPRRLAAMEKTLDAVARALGDPVDGGFFRYAERREWREPHTEKMLYVNASLALAFHAASRVFKGRRFGEARDGAVAYMLRTLRDAKDGGFYGSQTADPAYYRLPKAERSIARRPPVNRDKVTAWNAEAALSLLAIGEATGRKDVKQAALGALDFMARHVVTERGAYHIYRPATGRAELPGQLEANAWAALAFLEGHRVSGNAAYREAAEKILRWALAELADRERGGFIETAGLDGDGRPRAAEVSLDANGVMAEALLHAARGGGRREYEDAATRALARLGGSLRTVLVDERDSPAPSVADAVPALRAYARLLGKG